MSIDEPRRPAPVAAVVVDSGLAHLDRLFEYAVPPDLDEAAQPGARVRVRFAGRDPTRSSSNADRHLSTRADLPSFVAW